MEYALLLSFIALVASIALSDLGDKVLTVFGRLLSPLSDWEINDERVIEDRIKLDFQKRSFF